MANADAVIATRAFKILYKTFDAANALPADTVGYDDAVTGFTDIGYTSGGLTLGVDQTRNEIRVDQEFFPVQNPITEVNVTLGSELAEMTPANFKIATGLGTITTVAAASGTEGHDLLTINSNFTDQFNTILARIKQPNGEVFDVALWKALATGSVSTTFAPDNPATIAVEWSGLVDTSTSPGRIASVNRVTPALA